MVLSHPHIDNADLIMIPMHRQSTMKATERSKAEIPPGTLEMLILKTLKRFGPMHGYAMAKSIQQTSEEILRVEEGSLYPALQRILAKGWVTAEWVQAGPKRRNRIYRLTPEGRKQLLAEIAQYRLVSQAIDRVIEPA
jgi:PadR family transcriptional regulator PadR